MAFSGHIAVISFLDITDMRGEFNTPIELPFIMLENNPQYHLLFVTNNI